MEKMFLQPFVITILLLFLSSSGVEVFTALLVFAITIIVTYICYTLKTQLKLDKIIKRILKIKTKDDIEAIPIDNSTRQHEGLNVFPKPIAQILRKYTNGILKDFIRSWYIYIGPDETQFLAEVEKTLEIVFLKLYFRLEHVDLHKVVVDLIQMFQVHIKVFDDCRNIVLRKYPSIQEDDFAHCMFQLYEAGINKHIATQSKGMEIDHLKSILDIVFYKFLPIDTFSCESGRFMLREVLATQLLEPLLKDVTDPYFVNQILVDILEPSIPLPIVIKAFNDAENEIIEEENDAVVVESEKEDDISDHHYESSKEEVEKPHKSDSTSSSPTKEIYKHSEFYLVESFSNSNDDVLRFDNLDRKRSAPVYGSKSARDHEKDKKASKYALISSSNLNEIKNSVDIGRVESGHDVTVNQLDNTVFASPQHGQTWAVCPTSDDIVFRKESFENMPKLQDDLSERVVARLNSIGPSMLPTSCMINCPPLQSSSKRTVSLTGSVNMNFNKKQEIDKGELVTEEPVSKIDSMNIKYHKSGEDGSFYEMAPSCPTCIEMTLLASPFENEKATAVLYEKDKKIFEHDCGLSSEHFYYPETDQEQSLFDDLDDQSFASCDDINELLNDNSISSGTLLASGESADLTSSDPSPITLKSDSYDIVSSQSETSNLSDDTSGSLDDIESLNSDEILTDNKRHRTPSIATYKTALEQSISSFVVKSKHKKTSVNKSSKNHVLNFFKSGFPLISKKSKTLIKPSKEKVTHKQKRRHRTKNIKMYRDHRRRNLSENSETTQSISTTLTKFKSLPDSNSGPLHQAIWDKRGSIMGEFIEEVHEAHEALEHDDQYLEEFKDASSQFYSSSPDSAIPVDPLSKEIAVTDKDLPLDSKSVKSVKSSRSNDSNERSKNQNANFIPIYQGEVIMPHPSKLPAAWQYPIQMISIPTTEVAFEKGWEPGINKYTLYSIHYDIRICPEFYQKQLLEAKEKNNGVEGEKDAVPVIREIKRRYREFLYLHNRFSHGVLSKCMKGILRPNRRYAMPFGRMDPDVIEGRRKILETYLVSLVSRQELCNSREFKDFLGSEDYGDAAVLKAKRIAEIQISNFSTTVKSEQPGVHKDERLDKGFNTPYFIHGYEVPRMFGYEDELSLKSHSAVWFSHFIEHYFTFQSNLETKSLKESSIIASFEPVQKPKLYMPSVEKEGPFDTVDSAIDLGPRTSGDGSENPNVTVNERNVRFDDTVKKHDGRTQFRSMQIAAKFSQELASQLQDERERLLMNIAREKSLYQSSWPLTDAVLSIACQALKGFGSWFTFESVQQAILFSLGGLVEWLIGRELDEVIMKERCYKYLVDLYKIVWDERDELREKKPDPSSEERQQMKDEALKRVKDIIPSVVMWSVGPQNFHECCSRLLGTLQHQKINRHVLYAVLDLILMELIPELEADYPQYLRDAINHMKKR